jgi:hypothetical protein
MACDNYTSKRAFVDSSHVESQEEIFHKFQDAPVSNARKYPFIHK